MAPATGGAMIGAGLALRGVPARAMAGVGAGWVATTVIRPSEGRDVAGRFDLARPVTLRGDIGESRGRDRWGRHQTLLRVRTVRQGADVAPVQLDVDVRSTHRVAPGRVRIKGYLRSGPTARMKLSVKDPRLVRVESEPRSGDSAGLRRLRRVLLAHTEQRLAALVDDQSQRALLYSLVFGRSQDLEPDMRTAFRRLGLGHLFAVSGLHVGIVAGLAWIAGGAGGGRTLRLRRLAVIVLVLGYAWMLGPRGSVLRAATIVVLWQLVELLGRRLDPLAALATCVAGLVLLDPRWLADLGLQLSVLAVIGILLVGVPVAATLTPRLGWSGALLGVGLGAQLATLPLAAATFHWLAPLAPFYGLLAIPWATAILLVAAGAVLLPLPASVLGFVGWVLEFLLAGGSWLATLPPLPIDGWPVTLVDGCLYAAALLLCLLPLIYRSGSLWLRRSAQVGGIGLLLVVVVPAAQPAPRLVMLDVGQGDAFLLQANGRNLLLDGGGYDRVLLARLAAYGVRSLDTLIVSHPDRDHCAGARDVARWIRVREVWTPGGWTSDCYRALLTLLGTRLRPLWAGRLRTWQGMDFQVLAPNPSGTRLDNDDSLVVRLNAGSSPSVLLTGDIEFRGERKLMRRVPCQLLTSDILKVAHHGGRSSTHRPFLRCVQPGIALVSAGAENVFGHPAKEVLERLETQGVDVLRSDRLGSIELALECPSPLAR